MKIRTYPKWTLILCSILCIGPHCWSADSDVNESKVPNIGHYVYGPYEYFSEELPAAKDGKIPRNRVYIMPQIMVIPEKSNVYLNGNSVSPSKQLEESPVKLEKIPENLTHFEKTITVTTPTRYDAKIAVRFAPPSIPMWVRVLLLKNAMNAKMPEGIRKELIQFASDDVPQELKTVYPKLDDPTDSDNKIDDISPSKMRYEVVIPSSVSATLTILGKDKASITTPAASQLSTFSTLAFYANNLSKQEAEAIRRGDFTITAHMSVPLSRIQIAFARYDLSQYAKVISNEFAKRTTTTTTKERGFLFWKKIESSVSTFLQADSSYDMDTRSDSSAFVVFRDVEDPNLKAAALNYIFPKKSGVSKDLQTLLEEHQQAAREAAARNDTKAAEAHNKYAEYLIGLAKGKNENQLAQQAMDALAGLAQSGAQSGADGAAAASGNPYLAVANFLVNGIAWKNEERGDNYEFRSMRTATFSALDTRTFNGLIANQVQAGYTLSETYFPQMQLFLNDEYQKLSDQKAINAHINKLLVGPK